MDQLLYNNGQYGELNREETSEEDVIGSNSGAYKVSAGGCTGLEQVRKKLPGDNWLT